MAESLLKVKVGRKDLVQALKRVKSFVSKKDDIPILSHVLITAGSQGLSLTGGDLQIGLECTVDSQVEFPGECTLNLRYLLKIVSALTEDEVMIEYLGNESVQITSGDTNTTLYSMPAEDYPRIMPNVLNAFAVIPQPILKALISKTVFAVSTDPARNKLTGLQLHVERKILRAVACNGAQISVYEEVYSGTDIKPMCLLIPGKAMSIFERILGDEGEVNVFANDSQVAFTLPGTRLVAGLLDGESYPNYKHVIPKQNKCTLTISTSHLLHALQRADAMTSTHFFTVKLLCRADATKLSIETPEIGTYEEDLKAHYKGEDLELAFNPTFMLDIVKRIDSLNVTIHLKDANAPILIKPSGNGSSGSYQNAVSPIRL